MKKKSQQNLKKRKPLHHAWLTHQVFVSARHHQSVGGQLVEGRAAVEVVLEGHPAGQTVPLEVGAEPDQVLAVGAAVTAAHQLPQTLGMTLRRREGASGQTNCSRSDILTGSSSVKAKSYYTTEKPNKIR